MSLTAVQLVNVATLACLLETKVTDEQYNQRWIDTDGKMCAAGHAAANRHLFFTEKEIPVGQNLVQRLLRITPEPRVERQAFAPEVTDNDRGYWAVKAFGDEMWNAVFRGYAFDNIAITPEYVTRRMVINRLNQIARDGQYIPEQATA